MSTDAEPLTGKAKIAANLLAIRKRMGLDQDDFARLVGKARSQYLSYEHGHVHMGKAVLDGIAKRLKIKPEELGEPFDKYAERPYMRRRKSDSNMRARAHFLGDSEVTDPLRSALPQHLGRSVDVASYPDPELLERFLGLWRALPSAESRQRVFDCAVGELAHGVPPRTAVPKVRASAV